MAKAFGEEITKFDVFEPEAVCLTDERFGSLERYNAFGDGPKFVCGIDILATKERCLVYSVGSNNQVDFERGIKQFIGCETHTFDPTLSEPFVGGEYSAFHPWGLGLDGVESSGNGKTWTGMSLEHIMQSLGHSNRTIDILKIDCEGCEWTVLPPFFELIASGKIQVDQLQVELHGGEVPVTLEAMSRFFLAADKAKLRIFHKERNHWGCGGSRCVEYSLISESFLREANGAVMCPGSSVSPRTTSEDVTSTDHGCKKLGLPKPMEDIPLPPRAYTHDRGNTFNFLIIQMNQLLFAMPNHDWVTSAINQKTGIMNVWNNGNIWNRVAESNPKDGIFVDVGGWVGDTSIPSAAMGIDTYVFEPVRNNTNMIHFAISANGCRVSEHLTVVNAMVGDKNSANESIYVTSRADNAAATKAQAIKYVGQDASDFEQPIEMITLDSFFPPGTRVQSFKIDVQGFEIQVLRGAQRILEENREWLNVRLEYVESLIEAAGNDPLELLAFMESIGYYIALKDNEDIVMKATSKSK